MGEGGVMGEPLLYTTGCSIKIALSAKAPLSRAHWPSILLSPPLAMVWVYSLLLPQYQPLILKFPYKTPNEDPGQPLLNYELTKVNLKQNTKDPWSLPSAAQKGRFDPLLLQHTWVCS